MYTKLVHILKLTIVIKFFNILWDLITNRVKLKV